MIWQPANQLSTVTARSITDMPSLEQLVRSIDARIREVNHEIESLQGARSALLANGSAPAAAQAIERRPARRLRRRRARPTPARRAEVLLAETAERMLAETDGMSTGTLARQAGADRDQVLALLRDLETAQRVRRTGQRGATRWHAITDEDRIRERAADLASRTRGRST